MSDQDQDQDQDRALARAYRRTHEPSDRDDCPPPQTLAALASGETDAASEELLDHVAACSACAAEVGIALEADMPLRGLAGRLRGERPTRRRRWLIWTPAVAMLVAVLALPLVLRFDTVPPEPIVRGDGEQVVPAKGATLDQPPRRYEWPEVPGARRYRLVLMNAAAERVWTSDWTTASGLTLDDDVVERLREPGVYIWQVRVEGAGTNLGPYDFRLAGKY